MFDSARPTRTRSTKIAGSGEVTSLWTSMRPSSPVRYGFTISATRSGRFTGAGRAVGEVTRYADSHAFPNGRSARAYLIVQEDGAQKWFPAQDLERNCSTP